MKTTAVVESLSYYQTNVLFQRIPAYFKNNVCDCTPQFYLILALSITIIGLVIFAILHIRRINYVEDNYSQM